MLFLFATGVVVVVVVVVGTSWGWTSVPYNTRTQSFMSAYVTVIKQGLEKHFNGLVFGDQKLVFYVLLLKRTNSIIKSLKKM